MSIKPRGDAWFHSWVSMIQKECMP